MPYTDKNEEYYERFYKLGYEEGKKQSKPKFIPFNIHSPPPNGYYWVLVTRPNINVIDNRKGASRFVTLCYINKDVEITFTPVDDTVFGSVEEHDVISHYQELTIPDPIPSTTSH